MFFRMPDTRKLAWGNPQANQLPEAVKRLRTASHPVTATLHAITILLVLFVVAALLLDEDMPPKVYGGFILAITILSGLSLYLSRGTKRAKETVLAAHDNYRQVILVDSDGYRLLNDALFRRFRRLALGTLLNSPEYHQVMLDYIRDIEVTVAQLNVADGHQAKLTAHKRLVDIAEATAGAIAQIYADESSIEV